MHINSNQVNVHSSIVASYRKKTEREKEYIRIQRKRGGERWRMLAIICIAPSRQVWVRNWRDAAAIETHDHHHYSDCCYVYACQILMNERQEFVWKIPLCLVFISEKNVLFFRISVSDKYVLLMNNLSPAVYVYDLLLFRDTFARLNFLMNI